MATGFIIVAPRKCEQGRQACQEGGEEVTPKEAQKAMDCVDTLTLNLNWEKAPAYVRRAYSYLVRPCQKYGAK
jgi:hypothetical protein